MLQTLKRLHGDEKGLKTLEVVAILAIAAIILAVIKMFWNKIYDWFSAESKTVDSDWKKAE